MLTAAVADLVKSPAIFVSGLNTIKSKSSLSLYFMPVADVAIHTPEIGGISGNVSGANGDIFGSVMLVFFQVNAIHFYRDHLLC